MIPVHRRMLDATLARQLRADARAKGVARRLMGTINQFWDVILDLLPDSPTAAHHAAMRMRPVLLHLRQILRRQLVLDLLGVAGWAHASAARALTARARHLVARRERNTGVDEPTPLEDPFERFRGAVLFNPDGTFTVRNPEPIADGRFDYSRLLVEPPSAFELSRIVGPAPLRLSKLFDPDRVAGTVWQGIAQGQDRRSIAKDLMRVLNNDAVAARRVARTEGLRVATQMQLSASESIPELVAGYQILATLDSRTRPEHRARHGTIYHRQPHGSQKGFDQMPHPPIEADGTVAYNCRCMLAPVFADEPAPSVGYLLHTPYVGDAAANAAASLAV